MFSVINRKVKKEVKVNCHLKITFFIRKTQSDKLNYLNYLIVRIFRSPEAIGYIRIFTFSIILISISYIALKKLTNAESR